MMLTGSRPRLDVALEAAVLRPPPMSAVADPEQPGAIPLRIVTALSTSAHRDLPRPCFAAPHRSAPEGTGRRAFTALDLQVDCSHTVLRNTDCRPCGGGRPYGHHPVAIAFSGSVVAHLLHRRSR